MEEMREQWLAAIERNQRNLTAPGDERYWSPDLDTVSREQLREIQSDKLPTAVAYMAAHSAMYAQETRRRRTLNRATSARSMTFNYFPSSRRRT